MISVPDPSHIAKSCRNAMLVGAKSLTLGSGTISFSLVDTLFDQEERALKYSDLHNLDRQDDRAALRLFSAANLRCMLDEEGQGIQEDYIGMFLICFVFGGWWLASGRYTFDDLNTAFQGSCLMRG